MRQAIVFVCLVGLASCRAPSDALPGWAVSGVVIHVPDSLTVPAGQPVRAVISTSAPLGEVPELSAADLPPGATFADRGDGAAWFLWTPATDQTGKTVVRFGASAGGELAEAQWEIRVAHGKTPAGDGAGGGGNGGNDGGGGTAQPGNAPPSLTAASITGFTFTRADTLRIVTQGWYDVEGAAEQIVVQWFINGTAVSDATGRALPTGLLARGDAVYADVHPVDGVHFGAVVRTPTVWIRNAPPVALGITFGLAPYTAATGVRAWAAGCIDDDGDACVMRYGWSVNGVALGVTTAELPGGLVARGDVVTVSAIPFDGADEGYPVFAAPITIENAAPVAPRVRIGPVGIKYDTASLWLTQLAPAFDADGDAVALAYRWFRNGALYAEGASSPAVLDSLRHGDVWVAEVTPADGETYGAPATAWVRVDLRRLKAVAAGGAFTCAILNDGVAQCWGSNLYGQLGGNIAGAQSAVPVNVVNLSSDSVALAAGKEHACAIVSAGSLFCWGRNDSGQLGAVGAGASVAQLVTGVTQAVRSVAAGAKHTCVVQGAGEVWCWGDNQAGQLGAPGAGSHLARKVALPVTALTVAAGTSHACALLVDRTVRCWGSNGDGQIGAPLTTAQTEVAQAVAGVTDAVQVAAGGSHSCVVSMSGNAYCWGRNVAGQLGNGNAAIAYSTTPLAVVGGGVYEAIAAGDAHTCAVRTDGYMACWGASNAHQLGTGTSTASPTPTPQLLSSMPKTTGLAAGGAHTCGLTKGGAVRCWGSRASGETGDGTVSATARTTPYGVSGLSAVGAIDVAAGVDHSCAVTAYGVVKCWGLGSSGQLGNGSFSATPVLRPTDVIGITNAVEVVAGDYHTCARLATGMVKCWGANNLWQLGNGGTANSATPVALSGQTAADTASRIVAGAAYNCIIYLPANYVACWGRASRGPLSFGSSLVVGTFGNGYSAIGAGGAHLCVYQSINNSYRNAGIYCLGENSFGQFGNGGNTSSASLVSTGISCPASHIAGGFGHTCVDCGTAISCAGKGGSGQLGRGTVSTTYGFAKVALASGVAILGSNGLSSGGANSCSWGPNATCWGAPFLGDGLQVESLYAKTIEIQEPLGQRASSLDDGHEGSFSHSCDATTTGTVYCWGYNRSGSVGFLSEEPVARPRELELSPFWW